MQQVNINGEVHNISSCADPDKYQHLLQEFEEEKPGCPFNSDAAETLAKPPERQGWQQSYVKAREQWRK